MLTIIQQIILGIVQGVTEWIPISSEGALLFISSTFFGQVELETFLRQALFLHLGTFFAALIYFRKDVFNLLKSIKNYDRADTENKKLLSFLFIATIISGFVGLAFLQIFNFIELEDTIILNTSKVITLAIALLLLVTGYLQIRSRKVSKGNKTIYHLNNSDSITLGFIQGLSVLPGLSRSGLTVSSLLLKGFDDKAALRLSFLMSLPIVLMGNIILNFRDFTFVSSMLWGLLFSFIFGLLTINVLMRFAERVKFGHFVIVMAILMIISVFFRG